MRFDVTPGARVRIGPGVAIGDETLIRVHGATLDIGEGTVFGARCVIEARTRSEIGVGARFADEVVLLDHRPVTDDPDRPVREQGLVARGISIGDGARIGPRAAIETGVTIGPRAQIGAMAVVSEDIPADGLFVGQPSPRAPSTGSRSGLR